MDVTPTLPGAVVVDRLTVASEVTCDGACAPVVLAQPLLLLPGQRHRLEVERRMLIVEDEDGRSTVHPCRFATDSDAPR